MDGRSRLSDLRFAHTGVRALCSISGLVRDVLVSVARWLSATRVWPTTCPDLAALVICPVTSDDHEAGEACEVMTTISIATRIRVLYEQERTGGSIIPSLLTKCH